MAVAVAVAVCHRPEHCSCFRWLQLRAVAVAVAVQHRPERGSCFRRLQLRAVAVAVALQHRRRLQLAAAVVVAVAAAVAGTGKRPSVQCLACLVGRGEW